MSKDSSKELKAIITGLLVSNPKRSTVKDLCKDFVEFNGYRIPFRSMGFASAEEYFRSIPDTCLVHGTGPFAFVEPVIQQKSAHINSMVCKQKGAKIFSHDKRRRTFTLPNDKRTSLIIDQSPTNNLNRDECAGSIPKKNTKETDVHTPVDKNVSRKVEECTGNLPKKKTTKTDVPPTPVDKNGSRRIEECTGNLPKKKSTETALPPPLNRNVNRKVISPKRNLVFDDQYPSNIPKELRNNLKRLMGQFPNGILCTDLPDEYKKMFNTDLQFVKYRYRSLVEMCANLSDIFYYVRSSNYDYMLFDNTKPLPKAATQIHPEVTLIQEEVEESCDLDNSPLLKWNLIPKIDPVNIMTIRDTVPQYSERHAVGDFIDICLGHISSPIDFWIYLRNGPLDNFMVDMRQFYQQEKYAHIIPECSLKVGLYCVAFFNDRYYRVVINELLFNVPRQVEVQFVDYGNVEILPVDALSFLSKIFGYVPSQAVRARLSKFSAQESWSADCINRLRELSGKERELVGEITEIHPEENILELCIGDVTDMDNIFFLSDVLVKEGFVSAKR